MYICTDVYIYVLKENVCVCVLMCVFVLHVHIYIYIDVLDNWLFQVEKKRGRDLCVCVYELMYMCVCIYPPLPPG